MYGQDILCGISKGTFEIPHKIPYPYIETYNVISSQIYDLVCIFETLMPSVATV